MRWLQVCLVSALVLSAAACAKPRPVVEDPGIAPYRERFAFTPTAGTPRHEVEARLGTPWHSGYTKEDGLICLYRLEGTSDVRIYDAAHDLDILDGMSIVRTVVYDRDGNTLAWYGFERGEQITAAPHRQEEEQ